MELRNHPDYSYRNEQVKNGERKLPTPAEFVAVNGKMPSLDIRSIDCSSMDLSCYDNNRILFDEKTIFPTDKSKMPKDFIPKEIMEQHKNPGLGVRNLHKQGFTGKGLSVAIIDQELSPHQEYMDNLVLYKEFGYDDDIRYKHNYGSVHGAAVSSALVGKTCGVAPDAKLYYYGAKITHANGNSSSINYAKALNDILDLNNQLEEDKKIQAVSISWGAMDMVEGKEEWEKAFERAKKEGLPVITTNLPATYGLRFVGLGRDNNANPENVSSYKEGYWRQGPNAFSLGVPMDNRTLACPQRKDAYVHYCHGGLSWATPFYVGLFLLAKQADRNISLENFHKKALETGIYKNGLGTIAQPEKIISAILRERQLQQQFIAEKFKRQR